MDGDVEHDSDLDGSFRSVCLASRKRLGFSKTRAGKNLLYKTPKSAEKPWNKIVEADVRNFLALLDDPVVKSFSIHDVCFRSLDQYLVSMVFVYFKKARLRHEEYTRDHFFRALYLAHEMEEEYEENRWELLPWALGRQWQYRLREFVAAKNELWQRMSFRGVVPAKACWQVLSLPAFQKHSAFLRVRDSSHSEILRKPPSVRFGTQKYRPIGPLWQSDIGKEWLLRSKPAMMKGELELRSCEHCQDADPKISATIARSWLAADEIRETFLSAANILDPDWMTNIISTLEATGLDMESPLTSFNQAEIRENIDNIVYNLTCTDEEDLFSFNTKKRKLSQQQEKEVRQYIDTAQVKRVRFAPDLGIDDIGSILFAD